MTDEKNNQVNLDALKQSHDYFATAIHVLRTRVQFFYEEFEGIQKTVSFLEANRANLAKMIDEIEPPKPQEPKKPYIMEVPLQAPKVTDEQANETKE